MKIVIPGGGGQVGTLLTRALLARGHQVVILSRRSISTPARLVSWDGAHVEAWRNELDGATAVINLAGRSVNCRYGSRQRGEILDSRLASTRAVGDAIASCDQPPATWLRMSTATIYAHTLGAPNDELSGTIGGNEPGVPDSWRFSIDVARSWEDAASSFELPRTRQVLLRSALVLSPDRGGIFDTLARLAAIGLGGPNGPGTQYVSWIHEHDLVRAILWLLEHEELSGPVNLASPHPLPNAEFMRDLRVALGVPVGLPATRWMLEIGAFCLRTETELVLKSRRVVPTRLLESGFEFEYPRWKEAARELVHRRREKS